MKAIFLIISLVYAGNIFASDFRILQLDEVRVDYMSFFSKGRDPMITNNGLPDRELGKLLDMQISTTVLKYGYWRSLVHSYTDAVMNSEGGSQFRSVGLNMELGIRLFSQLDIFYWHYSQHLLDTTSDKIGGFPVQDAVGIHLYLYSSDRKKSLF